MLFHRKYQLRVVLYVDERVRQRLVHRVAQVVADDQAPLCDGGQTGALDGGGKERVSENSGWG